MRRFLTSLPSIGNLSCFEQASQHGTGVEVQLVERFRPGVYSTSYFSLARNAMSSISIAELDHAVGQMGVYGCRYTFDTATEPEVKNNKFKQMPAGSPRTSRVQKFFANIIKLGSSAIKWVKETIPQKIAISRFHTVRQNSLKALKAAIASQKFEEQVEKFKNFVEYDHQLTNMHEKDQRLSKEIWDSYTNQLSNCVTHNFGELDSLVRTLYNTCTHPYVEAGILNELMPVHKSVSKFLDFYAQSDKHKIIINQVWYRWSND